MKSFSSMSALIGLALVMRVTSTPINDATSKVPTVSVLNLVQIRGGAANTSLRLTSSRLSRAGEHTTLGMSRPTIPRG
ncbi:hypothetical protein DFP72DRAFT_883284 [Ephemerocybe angulata]|uniref:Secreted protein n=1 Tax=Ephemerocybe angulata TaxID=980116 RepID=A0A8H6I978_9AGAR|nr:hypothetical protein DFP72DRAFT_883284 [Tulosesus angulatus]